ncbi:alpha/beta fold hydrolase [Kribbella sp. NPDC056345]|uniref:alpha/beta fold hydrolase n=1 Tax=Kribbella sp. NPDC056345 TaxID=3345789 RepID=UPI0035DDB42A
MLTYRIKGDGMPVVCVPGGMLPATYLGDLGGLPGRLILVDPRGSDGQGDPESWRCDRQVAELEAVREHLGLERMTLLAHSAGASLVTQYVVQHPERIARLVLVTPSPSSVGIQLTAERRRRVLELRKDEPWYDEVAAAFEALQTGGDVERSALNPIGYARWDEEAQAQQAFEDGLAVPGALGAYYADGAFDPVETRAALGRLDVPVLVIAGALDLALDAAAGAEFAGLFPRGEAVVLEGAAHHPWLDERDAFVGTVERFLTTG